MVFFHSLLSLRPKQWIKNLLLFVAPFAAGIGFSFRLTDSLLGFFAFCFASSIGYIVNDLNDIELDRLHPRKKQRPFAAGNLSFKSGICLILLLILLLSILVSMLPIKFTFVIAMYLLNTHLYTKFFKTIPVIEMFSISFGFILRLISGAIVLDLAISSWFLIVGGFGALFVVSAKRLAEFKHIKQREVRKVIHEYTDQFLYSSTSISVAVSVTGYCMWALSENTNPFWHQISIVPFVMAFFRYRWIAERVVVEAPEDAILGDKSLLILMVSLVVCLSIAIF